MLFGENRYGYDFIDTDNKLGEQIATQYALDKNYQSIVFIGIDEKILAREKLIYQHLAEAYDS